MKKLFFILMVVLVPLAACSGNNEDKDEKPLQLSKVMDAIKQYIDVVERETLFYSELATEQGAYTTNEGDVIAIYVFDNEDKEKGALEIHSNFMNMNYGDSLIKYSKGNVEVVFIKANNKSFDIENKLTKAIGDL